MLILAQEFLGYLPRMQTFQTMNSRNGPFASRFFRILNCREDMTAHFTERSLGNTKVSAKFTVIHLLLHGDGGDYTDVAVIQVIRYMKCATQHRWASPPTWI